MPDYLYNLPYIIQVLCTVLGIFVAMTIHSLTKAIVSHVLGDDTPKKHGRLTLNPIKHCEPIGFFLMMFLGFGWDRPVKVNVKRYKNYKIGLMLVSITPIIVSILFGISMGGIGQYFLLSLNGNVSPVSAIFYRFLIFVARHSVAIGLFNLIPIYPLDGVQILSLILPPQKFIVWLKSEKMLQMVLIMLLYFEIIPLLFNPIISLLLFFV